MELSSSASFCVLNTCPLCYRKMIQNLWWAAGYNVVTIPRGGGAGALGGVLHPSIGAVLMSLSTIVVAINAQLLRRARL